MNNFNSKPFFYTLLLLVVICSNVFSNTANASDSQIFVDGNTLYGVSQQSILKANLRNGHLVISYADGSVMESWVDTNPRILSKLKSDGSLIWIGNGSLESDKILMSTQCSGAARTLTSAIESVQAACADGPSPTCDKAKDLLDQAMAAYVACLDQNG